MSTTNLNLSTLAGSEKLKTFPSPYNDNMEAIDSAFGAGFGVGTNNSVNQAINALADGLAIIANGNTHAAITSGQYVFVRNHGSLSEGLYVATTNISANATLSGSNLAADESGGLNSINSNKASKAGLQNLMFNQVDANGNASVSVISEYPTIAGIFRVGSTKPTGLPTEAGSYGSLVLFNAGSYWIHLYQDVNNVLYHARTTSATTPSSWKKMVSAETIMGIVNTVDSTETINFDSETRFLVYTNTSASTGTKPVNTNNGYLITFVRSSTTKIQIFREAATSSKRIYLRSQYQGTWSDWMYMTLT